MAEATAPQAARPGTPPLFQVERLRKRYGEATVVDDLSFDIAAGECLGVIGPNGAGKTTTLRMCLGLTAPDGGQITYQGEDGPLQMPRDALAIKARLGVVTQFDTLDPGLQLRREPLGLRPLLRLSARADRAAHPAAAGIRRALAQGRGQAR